MALHILCVFLIVLSSGFLLVENRSYNTGLIFYDLSTKQIFLPPTVSVSRGRGLANIKFSDKGSIWSTFGKPCDCRGPLCGCCVGIKVQQYNFDQKMCANVSYVKPMNEINLEVYLNETQSARYGVSARNPSPFCIPVMMGIPMSMCVQMSNVGLQGNNLNMCMDFIVRLASTQLFEMHFQCMKMGAQGVQWVGPDGSSVIPPGESKIKDDNDSDTLEYYDEEEAEKSNEIDTGNKAEEEEGENNEIVTNSKEEEEAVNVDNNDSKTKVKEEEEAEPEENDVSVESSKEGEGEEEEKGENNVVNTEDKKEQEMNEIATVEKEYENEFDTDYKETDQDVVEYENKAEEIVDDNELMKEDPLLTTEIEASEGEHDTKENEVNLSEEEKKEVVDMEFMDKDVVYQDAVDKEVVDMEVDGQEGVDKDVVDKVFVDNEIVDKDVVDKEIVDKDIVDKEIVDNDIVDKEVVDRDVVDQEGVDKDVVNNEVVDNDILRVPEYLNEILNNSTAFAEASSFVTLTNEKETAEAANTNDSVANEFLIAPLEVVTEEQLNVNMIIANLKPTMTITTATVSAIESNDIDNAATIATIMSSTMASATTTTTQPTAATLETLGISATPKTQEATTTVAATSSANAEENNDSDISQDNDSDYEDENENEESDENEEDEGAKEEESEEEENKSVMNESESQKEQLENVFNVKINAAGYDFNLSANNVVKEHEIGDGKEKQETDEDEDEDDEDEDETEEDSDEITSKSTAFDNNRPQNTSYIDNITTAMPAFSLTSLLTTNAIVEKTKNNSKPDKHLININSNHHQLATETIVNTLHKNDNSTSNTKTTSNNFNSTSTSNIAPNDSTSPSAVGGNISDLKMSQITGTVTPLTSARKLLALQRQSHPRQQQQQSQQRQRQRQRQQKQQQHKKWQYPLHQQVQQQHHNHIQYQLQTKRQQRNHRLHYGA